VADHHIDAQQRLVQAALQVFAAKGYEGASTREICRLAQVNVAAIHYYFGDKASLYREVFRLPEQIGQIPDEMDDPHTPVRTVLAAFYRHVMAYIVAPEQVQQMRMLMLREELQPSGALDTHSADGATRMHRQLIDFLCRAVGIEQADAALHHLAFSIGGIALVLFVQRTAVDQLAPELLVDDAALEATIERLADHGVALIDGEAARRAAALTHETGTRRAGKGSVDQPKTTVPHSSAAASSGGTGSNGGVAPHGAARSSQRLERS